MPHSVAQRELIMTRLSKTLMLLSKPKIEYFTAYQSLDVEVAFVFNFFRLFSSLFFALVVLPVIHILSQGDITHSPVSMEEKCCHPRLLS